MMLIGFSGPSGSGKTTLVNMVVERLRDKGYDVGVVEEVARKVFEEYRQDYGFNSLDEIRDSPYILNFQWSILWEQIVSENIELEKHDIVLTDRTIYDNLFFTLFWRPHMEGVYDLLETYMTGFNMAENNGRRYRLIFLCEPVDGNVDDGFRTPDLTYRRVQFEVIKRLLPDYHLLPVFKPEIRAGIAAGIIEKLVGLVEVRR